MNHMVALVVLVVTFPPMPTSLLHRHLGTLRPDRCPTMRMNHLMRNDCVSNLWFDKGRSNLTRCASMCVNRLRQGVHHRVYRLKLLKTSCLSTVERTRSHRTARFARFIPHRGWRLWPGNWGWRQVGHWTSRLRTRRGAHGTSPTKIANSGQRNW